ncbi:MAG: hypothetical protein ACKOXF_00630 [Chitinophagaceae bacterium]
MHILVFKTNITQSGEGTSISDVLNAISDIKWNFDHWDSDNILRIESEVDCSEDIIRIITHSGYICQALED